MKKEDKTEDIQIQRVLKKNRTLCSAGFSSRIVNCDACSFLGFEDNEKLILNRFFCNFCGWNDLYQDENGIQAMVEEIGPNGNVCHGPYSKDWAYEFQRCNNCMSVFEETLTACPKCFRDDCLMYPLIDLK